MADRLRIVQAGLGGWGRNWQKEVVPEVDLVELVASVDPVAESREAAAGPAYGSLSEALDSVEADAVLVTAGLVAHAPLAREALSAGKHVLVEKPFAPTVEEARSLVSLASEQGRTLMVSQNYRFFPAPRTVRRLMGELGALHRIDIDFRKMSKPRGRRASPHHALAQPLLSDMSIHHFDLLRFIIGAEPERIFCEAWTPSWSAFVGPAEAAASIAFPDGIGVSYRGSWVSAGAPTTWSGDWRMEFEHGEIAWASRADHGSSGDAVRMTRDGSPVEVSLDQVDYIDRQGTLSEFADAVLSGRTPQCSGADNIGTLGMSLAAIDSATEHRPVSL